MRVRRESPYLRAQQRLTRLDNWHQAKKGKGIVVYHCAEFAATSGIPTYSGGLGGLAGDTLKSAADLGYGMAGFGMLPRDGYFQQVIVDGRQQALPVRWNPHDVPELVLLENAGNFPMVSFPLAGGVAHAGVWEMEIPGQGGDFVPLFLADTTVASNPPGFSEISSQLYAVEKNHGSRATRIQQDILLGIGSMRALAILGIAGKVWHHLNEGHVALVTAELLKQMGVDLGTTPDEEIIAAAAARVSFATHTPIGAGFDYFNIGEMFSYLTDPYYQQVVRRFGLAPGNPSEVSMAHLALNLSGSTFAVSKKHGEVTRAAVFPGHGEIFHITNGSHHLTWASPHLKILHDRWCPGWREDPTQLSAVLALRGNELEQYYQELMGAKMKAKEELIREVNKRTGAGMEAGIFTIGFARRAAEYKRANLIFTDRNRLIELAKKARGLQIVFAGKAHPADDRGKGMISAIIHQCGEITRESGERVKAVFVPGYDLDLAGKFVAGAEVWLNTPECTYEASGTSGQKAALNGTVGVSTPDGWWLEGSYEDRPGYTINRDEKIDAAFDEHGYQADSRGLYRALEIAIDDWLAPHAFQQKMLHAIGEQGVYFNSHRMVKEYYGLALHPERINPPPTGESSMPPKEFSETMRSINTYAARIGAEESDEARIEGLIVEAILKNFAGAQRVTCYRVHNAPIRVESRWEKRGGERIFYVERPEDSSYQDWKGPEQYENEVMADVVKSRKMQVVLDPASEPKCYRSGKLVSQNPFVMVPEVVEGKIVGVYKIDLASDGKDQAEEVNRMGVALEVLLEMAGRAKARLWIAELEDKLNGFTDEARLVNWAITLMTAGGFSNMPPYAAQANRVAIFLAGGKRRMIGARAIGQVNAKDHGVSLARLIADMHTEYPETYFGRTEQRSELSRRVEGKEIGHGAFPTVVHVKEGLINVHSSVGVDVRRLAKLMEPLKDLFKVDGQEVREFIIIPIRGINDKVIGFVYADNAFSGELLELEKLEIIAGVLGKTLSRMRRQRSAALKEAKEKMTAALALPDD